MLVNNVPTIDAWRTEIPVDGCYQNSYWHELTDLKLHHTNVSESIPQILIVSRQNAYIISIVTYQSTVFHNMKSFFQILFVCTCFISCFVYDNRWNLKLLHDQIMWQKNMKTTWLSCRSSLFLSPIDNTYWKDDRSYLPGSHFRHRRRHSFLSAP